jgi:hypothetical protein
MTYEERHVKVTITIEDSEMIRTITIPKAREIDVSYQPPPVATYEPDPYTLIAHTPRSAGFQIRGMSDFDYKSQRLVIVETEIKLPYPVPPEVKVGKTTSELTPRELRRARFGGPRGGSPHIGRELKSKLKGKES